MNPRRISGLGRSVGEAVRGFKKGLNSDEIDVTDSSRTGRSQLESEDRT
jgi:Sec-independent protein translocase protein TatA